MEGAKLNVQAIGYQETYFEGKELAADNGYFSEKTLKYCEKEELDAYIPDTAKKGESKQEEKGKQENYSTRTRFSQKNFIFNETEKLYTCPNGNVLKRKEKHSKRYNRYYDIYEGKQEDCDICQLRMNCLKTKATKNKFLYIAQGFVEESAVERMRKKMETAEAREKYAKRFGTIEPVFGNVRSNKKWIDLP